MSGTEFPPPGAPPAAQPVRQAVWGSSGWGGPAPGQSGQPGQGPTPPSAQLWGAAHKPGAIPLRPLSLGDIYDGAFKIIRFNPRATVGPSVLVAAVSMAIPIVAVSVMTFALGMTGGPIVDDPYAQGGATTDVAGLVAPFGAFLVGRLLQYVGTILVTGMIVHVASSAAVGRRLTAGQTWAATRGRRWRLVGLATLVLVVELLVIAAYVVATALIVSSGEGPLVVLWVLVTGPAMVALVLFGMVRLAYLAAPALMLEDLGILAALRRAWALSARQFWRIFGIWLLAVVIISMASQMLAFPVSIGAQVLGLALEDGRLLFFFVIVGAALGQILTSALTVPFTAGVCALQYLDQRMRREAYDVELMTQAGVTRA